MFLDLRSEEILLRISNSTSKILKSNTEKDSSKEKKIEKE
jgi:hypothetical protein